MKGLRLSDLAKMSEEESDKAINEFLRAVLHPTAKEIEERKQELDEKIRAYEQEYGMTSEEMERKLRSREINEYGEIYKWRFLLMMRNKAKK